MHDTLIGAPNPIYTPRIKKPQKQHSNFQQSLLRFPKYINPKIMKTKQTTNLQTKKKKRIIFFKNLESLCHASGRASTWGGRGRGRDHNLRHRPLGGRGEGRRQKGGWEDYRREGGPRRRIRCCEGLEGICD